MTFLPEADAEIVSAAGHHFRFSSFSFWTKAAELCYIAYVAKLGKFNARVNKKNVNKSQIEQSKLLRHDVQNQSFSNKILVIYLG